MTGFFGYPSSLNYTLIVQIMVDGLTTQEIRRYKISFPLKLIPDNNFWMIFNVFKTT